MNNFKFLFLLLPFLLNFLFGDWLSEALIHKIQSLLMDAAGESESLFMMAPPGGEGGSGAGSSQRPGFDLNLPPGGGDKVSDLVAKLEQVENELSHLRESPIESPDGLEAKQRELARLKTVLDEIKNLLGEAREIDQVRDNERDRLREEQNASHDRWETLEKENARMRSQVNERALKRRGPLIKFNFK